MATPNDTREIPLTRGQVAIVDAVDYEALAQHKWQASRNRVTATFYASRTEWDGLSNRFISMHREIMGLRRGDPLVDHINGHGLDNRRDNLRVATGSQNQQNRRHLRGGNTKACGFIGVSVSWYVLADGQRRFRAQICVAGKGIHLGMFATERDAARAYDTAALSYYGPFAGTNAKLGLLHGI